MGRIGLGRVESGWVESGWVGLGHDFSGFGWVGSALRKFLVFVMIIS